MDSRSFAGKTSGLSALVAVVRDRERRRTNIARRLQRAEALTRATKLDAKRLERELLGELDDWRGLLADDAAAARPALRRLLVGRLVFTPLAAGIHGPVEFRGMASIGGLPTGTVGVHVWWRAQRDSNPTGCRCPACFLRRQCREAGSREKAG